MNIEKLKVILIVWIFRPACPHSEGTNSYTCNSDLDFFAQNVDQARLKKNKPCSYEYPVTILTFDFSKSILLVNSLPT